MRRRAKVRPGGVAADPFRRRRDERKNEIVVSTDLRETRSVEEQSAETDHLGEVVLRLREAAELSHVTKPSSGSCWPIDGTSARVRSMLILQNIRRRPRGP